MKEKTENVKQEKEDEIKNLKKTGGNKQERIYQTPETKHCTNQRKRTG